MRPPNATKFLLKNIDQIIKPVHFNIQMKGRSVDCTIDFKSVLYGSNLYVWQPQFRVKIMSQFNIEYNKSDCIAIDLIQFVKLDYRALNQNFNLKSKTNKNNKEETFGLSLIHSRIDLIIDKVIL